jgi:hypothetical protein
MCTSETLAADVATEDAAFEELVLTLEVGVGFGVFGAVLREGSAGPIDLEEGLAMSVTRSLYLARDLYRFGGLLIVEAGDGLAPHAAELDPLEAEVIGSDKAGVIEVGRDFVVDDRKAEGAGRLGCFYLSSELRDAQAGGCQSQDKVATRAGHFVSVIFFVIWWRLSLVETC